jgi:membrane-associated protein
MDLIHQIVSYFLHLDIHLGEIIASYGAVTYAILFAIIFCETGLVVTPFLPGDSLLFAAGVFAAKGQLHLSALLVLLAVAAVLGDTVNYWIGRMLEPRLVRGETIRFVKQKHIDRTHEFFEKYGSETIIIARFVPIVRTFAPFVAGVGSMSYGKFISYNVIGGVLWVLVLTLGGYFFGNTQIVRDHFSYVVVAIIVISILPGVYEFLRQRKAARAASDTEKA